MTERIFTPTLSGGPYNRTKTFGPVAALKMDFNVLTYDTLDSTNTEALKHARLGAKEGLCIVARQQTAGRGRHGRTWNSPPDSGLYFSIMLHPKIDTRFLTLLTLMAGVAVHETLSGFGLKPDIKWVNDVLVGERKICGILAETTETTSGVAVIIGTGINLRSANFPPEISATATSIEAELGRAIAVEELIDPLTRNLARFYDLLAGPDGPSSIIDEWHARSTYFSGKAVRVVNETDTLTGITDGLEPNGALRLKLDDGGVSIVQAGQVERLRALG